MANDPTFRARDKPGHAGADGDPAKRDPKEVEGGILKRESTGERGGNRETQADQTRGIVQERFPFQHMHRPLRNGHALSDRRTGDRVGRRDDRGQRESDGKRHRGDHPVDEEAHADHGEDDEAERKSQDRPAILEQFFPRDAPAIEEQ